MKIPWKLYALLLLHLIFTLIKSIRKYGHFLCTFSLEAETETQCTSLLIP